jgi:hypothetical protein
VIAGDGRPEHPPSGKVKTVYRAAVSDPGVVPTPRETGGAILDSLIKTVGGTSELIKEFRNSLMALA